MDFKNPPNIPARALFSECRAIIGRDRYQYHSVVIGISIKCISLILLYPGYDIGTVVSVYLVHARVHGSGQIV